jgi:hypothetical protein
MVQGIVRGLSEYITIEEIHFNHIRRRMLRIKDPKEQRQLYRPNLYPHHDKSKANHAWFLLEEDPIQSLALPSLARVS